MESLNEKDKKIIAKGKLTALKSSRDKYHNKFEDLNNSIDELKMNLFAGTILGALIALTLASVIANIDNNIANIDNKLDGFEELCVEFDTSEQREVIFSEDTKVMSSHDKELYCRNVCVYSGMPTENRVGCVRACSLYLDTKYTYGNIYCTQTALIKTIE